MYKHDYGCDREMQVSDDDDDDDVTVIDDYEDYEGYDDYEGDLQVITTKLWYYHVLCSQYQWSTKEAIQSRFGPNDKWKLMIDVDVLDTSPGLL